MRTRSSSNLPVESSPNPSTSNPKRRNRRSSKQSFILEESIVDTMADQRTMVELLRAPTEGYVEAIVVPSILAEQFELKHTRRWLKKEPPRSILTWEDLVSKFINEFFPSSRITNLLNEISNFQQRFDESFHEAWDRYKDFLRACPSHGFTELHQLDTFYNALNPADQDSLNSAAGGNLLERRTQDVLTIIENKSKVRSSQNKSVVSQVKSSDANSNSSSEIAKLTHAVNQQMSAVTTAMTVILKQFQATPPPAFMKAVEEICVTCGGAHPYYQCLQQMSAVTTAMTVILKQFQATPPPASMKAVEEICVTCGGAHPYYQCLAAGGNTFPELRDNIQGYVAAAAVNYNHGNSVYRPPGVANQIRPPGFAQPNVQNNQNWFSQPQGYNRGNNFNPKQSYQAPTQQNPLSSGSLPSNTIANPKGELKAITTRSGIVLDGPFVLIPLPFVNPEEDERVEETLMDQDLAEYTIKLHINITLADALILIPKYQKMLKALLSNKEKLLELANTPFNENCSAKLGLLELISTHMTLELANRAICTPTGIARDVFIPVGKFTFPADFVIVDYESDPRVPLILGRPFLRTARALIDIHREEMIVRNGDEKLTLNIRHDTSSYSNQPQKESINLISIFNDSSEDFLENLFSINHQSGNPTFSSHPELTSPEVKDDIFNPEGGNVLPEKLLDLDSTKDLHPPHHDSVDQSNLDDLNDNLVDSMPEMFNKEHALDYTSPPLYDEYDDDLFKVESD
nr:hypothetical protein [Tanacetum cinerariifolium]